MGVSRRVEKEQGILGPYGYIGLMTFSTLKSILYIVYMQYTITPQDPHLTCNMGSIRRRDWGLANASLRAESC